MQNRNRKLCKTSNYISLNTFLVCVCARTCMCSCVLLYVCKCVHTCAWDCGGQRMSQVPFLVRHWPPHSLRQDLLLAWASLLGVGQPAAGINLPLSSQHQDYKCAPCFCAVPQLLNRYLSHTWQIWFSILSVFILSIHLREKQTDTPSAFFQRTSCGSVDNPGLPAWALFFPSVSAFKPVRSGWKFPLKY